MMCKKCEIVSTENMICRNCKSSEETWREDDRRSDDDDTSSTFDLDDSIHSHLDNIEMDNHLENTIYHDDESEYVAF